MKPYSGTITLKTPCRSCEGTGCYRTPINDPGVPCWTCRGRGWTSITIRKPDSKWAHQYDKEAKVKP